MSRLLCRSGNNQWSFISELVYMPWGPSTGLWRCVSVMMLVATLISGASRHSAADPAQRPDLVFRDPSGLIATVTTAPRFDATNPFFQSLGTNGRSCVTCHQPRDAWSITTPHIRLRFDTTAGFDPLFRSNDGATCPTADVSTLEARRRAYRLLLDKGLIRIGLPVPENAEFEVIRVDDPYDCTTDSELSVYRRPLPATNLKFLSAVMWDGRETVPGQSIADDLQTQALNATLGHAEASAPPTKAQLQDIVDFQLNLFTAQLTDNSAGRLQTDGAQGGPVPLSQQDFYLGINDPLGGNPTGASFDPEAFTLFSSWQELEDTTPVTAARASVARGEQIFNIRPIAITDVAGLNDALDQKVIMGTCTVCHDTPNVGNHSLSVPLDIGLSDAAQRTPDLPLFTLRCLTTGAVVRTSDPGRALITGKCADIGKMKGPILRGLAARAPYFHNGSAATLEEVVTFYDKRFQLKLSLEEKADLAAFLGSL